MIDKNTYFTSKRMTANRVVQIHDLYAQTHHRLILLDYDGTLAAFRDRPEDATPTPELLDMLGQLCADPENRVVINSGRDRQTLEHWLEHLRIDFAAEHGGCYKERRVWQYNVASMTWSEGLMSILRLFVDKTPHSHIEQKATTIVWHYREVDPWLGELRAQQLVRALVSICLQQNLQVMQGNKVIEIKSPVYTKGSEVRRLFQKETYDFMLAMGDDTTDEDMFCQLPSKTVTVKVGKTSELARYNIATQDEVLPFLRDMMGHPAAQKDAATRHGRRNILQIIRNLLKPQERCNI